MSELWFGVLGRLRARVGGADVALGPRKQQVVLAALLCNPNRYTSLDALVEAAWGERPPRTARKNLHVYVCSLRSRLRRAGGRECISHVDHGYVISLEPGELDSLMFEQLARSGSHLGDRALLRQALDLWQGQAFEGFHADAAIAASAEQLSRRYLTVFEAWAEAALGDEPGTVIDEIGAVIRSDPFRERLRVIQMSALHQQGRHGEALAVFDDYRQALTREFGLLPGAGIVRLRDRVLLDQPETVTVTGPVRSLPRLTGFIGRPHEQAELISALRERGQTAVVVTGPVGTGKTALAIRCAHELVDAFPDGQFFVSFKDAASTLRELLRAADVPVGSDPPAEVWQSWITRRRALVLLDDAPDEFTVMNILPRTGDSAVLITARGRLSGLTGAYRIDLTPLTADDGVELLAHHIGSARVAADPDAAGAIVRATGRSPLGIVMVGSKLAGLRHVPLREYAGRLDRSASILDELRVGTVAVRTRLESTVQALPEHVRGDYVRLGRLSRQAFTLAHATAALGADPYTTGVALEQLIEANVVTAPDVEVSAHEVVYEIPSLLFHYAVELAASA